MIISTWNINSVRIRLELISTWIEKRDPQIILLQEIKCQNEDFPFEFFTKLDFDAHVYGQKGKNGVAILVKKNLKNVNDKILKIDFLNNSDARVIKIYLSKLNVHIFNIYAPNGNPLSNNLKFLDKKKWYNKLVETLTPIIKQEEKVIIAGDFNILENERDVSNFDDWKSDALGSLEIRKKFREILGIGFLNSVRIFFVPGEKFSFWDYQKSSWERNDGLLIDHFLISPNILENISNFNIDSEVRGWKKPSDHTPVNLELNI